MSEASGRTRDEGEELDGRAAEDEVLVECLAAGMSFPAAGEMAGCSARTVSRRMSDPEFVLRVSRRRGERVRAITGQLTALADDALTTIRMVLEGGERDADRLRAAHLVLSHLGRFRADTDLEERLAELEDRLAGDGGEVA